MSWSHVDGWLRRLDRDASAGLLGSRRVAYLPAFVAGGAVFGVQLGYTLGIGLTIVLPEMTSVPGPDGTSMAVPTDNSGVPVLAAAAGSLAGLALGLAAAVRRSRRQARQ
jgi:hypothetical protein